MYRKYCNEYKREDVGGDVKKDCMLSRGAHLAAGRDMDENVSKNIWLVVSSSVTMNFTLALIQYACRYPS